MIRLDKHTFVGKQLYAVERDSFRTIIIPPSSSVIKCVCGAIWFKRRDGIISVSMGTLRNYYNTDLFEEPSGLFEFLRSYEDGRFGGDCVARFDGKNLWSDSKNVEVNKQRLKVLNSILGKFPNLPKNYDGWWRF